MQRDGCPSLEQTALSAPGGLESSGSTPGTVPRSFVSARHRTLVESDDWTMTWMPFGLHHAREVGAPRSACGMPELGWRIFWELPFPSEPSLTCRECMAAVCAGDAVDPT